MKALEKLIALRLVNLPAMIPNPPLGETVALLRVTELQSFQCFSRLHHE